MRILVVEDDYSIATTEQRALEREGYEVAVADSGRGAMEILQKWKPDLIVLDIQLPDADGRDLARRIRAVEDVAIIIVSGLGEEAERVGGLEAGADDYMVKPFSMPELLARIRAILRRAAHDHSTGVLEHGELTVDVGAHRVFLSGAEIALSPKEFEVLRVLMEQPGQMVARADLARAVWGMSPRELGKSLDVHLASLRRKLGDDAQHPKIIETVRGVGFRLAEATGPAED